MKQNGAFGGKTATGDGSTSDRNVYFKVLWAGRAQSVERLATGWTVRGSNPGGGVEIFRTRPYRPWGPPSLLYNGYRVFLGGKAAGAWR